jgi:hypothetical protein
VGNEQRRESDGPVPRAKAIGDTDVVFVSAIEPLDELFIVPIFFGFAIEILQANNLVMSKGLALGLCAPLGIDKMERIGIRAYPKTLYSVNCNRRASQMEKGFVVRSFLFPTNKETAISIHQTVCAFDNPAPCSMAWYVFLA